MLFSSRESTKTNYNNRIDALFNGKPANREGITVLDKSDVLDMLGHGGKPVILAEGKVIAGQTNHKLTPEHWKKIPEWLENPAAVFDSDTVKGSLVFIAPESFSGAPIRMIVVPNAKQGSLEIHMLANSYDAQIKAPTARWVREGLLRYIDKVKSPTLLARSGLQLSSMAQQPRGIKRKIYQYSDLAKYREYNTSKLNGNFEPCYGKVFLGNEDWSNAYDTSDMLHPLTELT